MPSRHEQHHRSPKDVPPVGRPRGAVWRSLQADGVVWEGQVLLVGEEVDLAARMIVTHRRVVFIRGGEAVLEIPRDWLRPEPVLRRDGVLDLFVAMPGSDLFDEPMTVPLRMREGPVAAGHIIAMLAPGGVRRIEPDALSGMERAREAAPLPTFGGFWDDDSDTGIGQRNGQVDSNALNEVATNGARHPDLPPVEPPDRVVRVPSTSPRAPQQTATFSIAGVAPRDQRRSPWVLFFRVAALTFLLVTAAALGAGRLNLPVSGGGFEAILAAPTPTGTPAGTPPTETSVALAPEEETAIGLGLGGPAAQTTTESPTPTVETSVAASPSPAAATTETPAAIVATEPAAPTPEPTAPPEPTESPPATTPTTPEAADEATAQAPAAGAEAGTPSSGHATPGTGLEQPAAVAADEAPAQEIVVGPLRIAITTALRGESLPRYGLPPGTGDWVLLETSLKNEGDAPASLAMSEFRLFDRGTALVADLDTGTGVIASLAGFDPAWTPADTIALDPGDSERALVLFLLPPGSSEDLALLIGQTSIDLAPSLALGEAGPAAAPTLVEATVSQVLDGARIVVDIDGLEETVQYLGIAAPAAGECFAAEATASNTELVGGHQVWLERQATDRTDDGVLLRDVWIAGSNGGRALVAARLLEAGAGTALSVAPDTRYESWLAAASALGRSNGAGLWAVCSEPTPASAAAPAVNSVARAFTFGGWRERWSLASR